MTTPQKNEEEDMLLSSSSSSSSSPLSKRMREATHNVHEKSDRLVNLKLAMVLASKPLYAEAISLFWPIYETLESLLEKHKNHEHLGLLYPLLPQLRRAHWFENDMAFLLETPAALEDLKSRRRRRCGDKDDDNNDSKEDDNNSKDDDKKSSLSPPELAEYVEHLQKLSEENPILLLAYVYAMYGAIMAGGAIIKRMVQGAFSLKRDDKRGVEIFRVCLDGSAFSNIAAFRKEMKRILDEEMNLTEKEKSLILQEAPQVFLRNNALVATVQDTPVFHAVWQTCKRYFLVLAPSVAVVMVAMMAYLARRK